MAEYRDGREYSDELGSSGVYRKWSESANSNKVYFEDMQIKIYRAIADAIRNNVIKCPEVINRAVEAARKVVYLSQFKDDPEFQALFRKYAKKIEPKPDLGTIEEMAINPNDVATCLSSYNKFVSDFKNVAVRLSDVVLPNAGSSSLKVSEYNFDQDIKTIITDIETYYSLMSEFSSAVDKRASFLHDVQRDYLIDFSRYYGSTNGWESKTVPGSREENGISV